MIGLFIKDSLELGVADLALLKLLPWSLAVAELL